jgi:hypothetical protein
MLTAEERKELRTALQLINAAYDVLAKLGRIRGQEPQGGQFDWTGWQDDGTGSNASEWSWEEPRREK